MMCNCIRENKFHLESLHLFRLSFMYRMTRKECEVLCQLLRWSDVPLIFVVIQPNPTDFGPQTYRMMTWVLSTRISSAISSKWLWERFWGIKVCSVCRIIFGHLCCAAGYLERRSCFLGMRFSPSKITTTLYFLWVMQMIHSVLAKKHRLQ